MKNIFFRLLPIVFAVSLSYAEEPGFSFTSTPLLFRPLTANTFEPRMGLIWHTDDSRLRLDIGNSIDMIQYIFTDPRRHLTIGSDFFTYTLLHGEKNFHFPVDAVDYLFGFNVNYIDTLNGGIFSSRLRLSHISAHFVDGHYDGANAQWKNGRNPRVYSREFFDLTTAFEPINIIRGYIGAEYLWHVDPTTLPKFEGYLGAEYHQCIAGVFNGYSAYQFTVTGLRPRHEFQIGVKIGMWHGRGSKIFLVYYSGNSIHGEYFDFLDKYSGVGFNIDF